jgi:hypothetical protein
MNYLGGSESGRLFLELNNRWKEEEHDNRP